jgi:TorA maturation chaperone TorD
MDQQHYRVAMAKDVYFSALLTLLLRAIIDDTLSSYSELELLLAFLLHAETAERIHNSFFTEALSDWVTRMIKGIKAATFTPSGRKRRSRILL